jgi:hypothetical protein
MLTCSSAPGLPLSGSVTADGLNASAYSTRFTVASPSKAALLDPCTDCIARVKIETGKIARGWLIANRLAAAAGVLRSHRRGTGRSCPCRRGAWWSPRWGRPTGTRRRRPPRGPTAPSAGRRPATSPPPSSPPIPAEAPARTENPPPVTPQKKLKHQSSVSTGES